MSHDRGRPPKAPTDLLAILDPDPLRAEAGYRELRRQLLRFLEWQRCHEPEEAAQEALARGFKRIAEGADTSTAGARGLFFGIAKNLVKEGWKSRKEELVDPADLERTPSPARHMEQVEARLTLNEYLGRLRGLERRLIVRYYTEDRVALCHELGVTAGGLRVMVHRIRRKIENLREDDQKRNECLRAGGRGVKRPAGLRTPAGGRTRVVSGESGAPGRRRSDADVLPGMSHRVASVRHGPRRP